MRKRILCCLLLCSMLAGCFSYKDMNRVLFSTMALGDMEGDQFVYYVEVFKGYRGEGEKSGSERRIVLYGEGDILTEAVIQIRNSANYPINYAGSKGFVFTKRMAEQGIGDAIDLIVRDQNPSLRQYLIIFDGKAEDMMNLTMPEEQFLGIYLYEQMDSKEDSLTIISTPFYYFNKNINTGSRINILPISSIQQTQQESEEESGGESQGQSGGEGEGQNGGASQGQSGGESGGSEDPLAQKSLIVSGAAVFVGDKMEAEMSLDELAIFKLLTEPVKTGLINTKNPTHPDKMVGFSVLGCKNDHTVEKDGDRILLKYTVDVRVLLLIAQQGIEAQKEEVQEQLKKELQEKIEKGAIELFESMREQGIDLFDVQRDVERTFWKDKPEDPLSITDFEVDVKVTLDGVGELGKTSY